jgi:hypothetical protein
LNQLAASIVPHIPLKTTNFPLDRELAGHITPQPRSTNRCVINPQQTLLERRNKSCEKAAAIQSAARRLPVGIATPLGIDADFVYLIKQINGLARQFKLKRDIEAILCGVHCGVALQNI